MNKIITPAEKARETRKANAARRKEHWAQERYDRQLIADAARAVLTDEAATASEKWQAALLLDNVAGYGLVKAPESADVETMNAQLKAAFEAIEK